AGGGSNLSAGRDSDAGSEQGAARKARSRGSPGESVAGRKRGRRSALESLAEGECPAAVAPDKRPAAEGRQPPLRKGKPASSCGGRLPSGPSRSPAAAAGR